ncbi:uncharacterized protein LOC132305273 [Cornus florida]|uniref:uncharacterized protein LOC132305273 n=1 Tax=Cornus florida TaxID=4283 RepID=UPI00289AF0FB|nr:uncharacterized protein LOC132305273 [Cornus florida]
MVRTTQYRDAITRFAQGSDEPFHKAWERFRDLLRKCPHHDMPKWQLVNFFHKGLNEAQKYMVDASCGGNFMLKSVEEAWQLFKNISDNFTQHVLPPVARPPTILRRAEGVNEVRINQGLVSQIKALTKKVGQLMTSQSNFIPPATNVQGFEVCSFCSSPTHHVSICPSASQYSEIPEEQRNPATRTSALPPQVPQVQGNFQSPVQTSNPQGFIPMNAFSQPQQFLSMLEAMMAKQLEPTNQLVQSHSQSLTKLETQVGQLAQALNRREDGKLPSQPVANPRGVRIIDDITGQEVRHEQVQAITTLRSGKRVENKLEEEEAKKDENWKKKLEEKKERNEKAQEVPPITEPSLEQRHVVVPFPQRLQETSKAAK